MSDTNKDAGNEIKDDVMDFAVFISKIIHSVSPRHKRFLKLVLLVYVNTLNINHAAKSRKHNRRSRPNKSGSQISWNKSADEYLLSLFNQDVQDEYFRNKDILKESSILSSIMTKHNNTSWFTSKVSNKGRSDNVRIKRYLGGTQRNVPWVNKCEQLNISDYSTESSTSSDLDVNLITQTHVDDRQYVPNVNECLVSNVNEVSQSSSAISERHSLPKTNECLVSNRNEVFHRSSNLEENLPSVNTQRCVNYNEILPIFNDYLPSIRNENFKESSTSSDLYSDLHMHKRVKYTHSQPKVNESNVKEVSQSSSASSERHSLPKANEYSVSNKKHIYQETDTSRNFEVTLLRASTQESVKNNEILPNFNKCLPSNSNQNSKECYTSEVSLFRLKDNQLLPHFNEYLPSNRNKTSQEISTSCGHEGNLPSVSTQRPKLQALRRWESMCKKCDEYPTKRMVNEHFDVSKSKSHEVNKSSSSSTSILLETVPINRNQSRNDAKYQKYIKLTSDGDSESSRSYLGSLNNDNSSSSNKDPYISNVGSPDKMNAKHAKYRKISSDSKSEDDSLVSFELELPILRKKLSNEGNAIYRKKMSIVHKSTVDYMKSLIRRVNITRSEEMYLRRNQPAKRIEEYVHSSENTDEILTISDDSSSSSFIDVVNL